jgi:ribulose-phosphate 3-epimerase
MNLTVLPSLLAADMSRLGDDIRRAVDAGADALHLDIMDGHFVPNISFGPAIVAMARKVCDLPLNVHLMLSRPASYITPFAEAGADLILTHIEADDPAADVLEQIASHGIKRGVTLNPATRAEACYDYLRASDQVLCMTVNPGYGGQAFMREVLPKFAAIRAEADRQGATELSIMVDGGINRETGVACAMQGVDAFVAGTYLFGAPDMAATLLDLREAVTQAATQGAV